MLTKALFSRAQIGAINIQIWFFPVQGWFQRKDTVAESSDEEED